MKKKTAKQRWKKLYNRACKLWKEIAFLRDGRYCQVRERYPDINVTHSEIYQVDHCITRRDKNLFFEVTNSTVVCMNCNGFKNRKQKGIDYAIQQIVISREGGSVFGMMMDVHQTHGPNHHWNKIWWMEKQVDLLETIKKELEGEVKPKIKGYRFDTIIMDELEE